MEAVTRRVLPVVLTYQQPPADWECITGKPPPAPSLNLSTAQMQLVQRGQRDLKLPPINISCACKLQTLPVSGTLKINGEPNLHSGWVSI